MQFVATIAFCLHRQWSIYTYPLSGKKIFPIFFCDWYDGPACLHQESGGVDPPTPIGGHPGGITPIFTPKIQNFKELVWAMLPWNFQCFNGFQLEMTWIFTYIRSRRVLLNIVEKRANKVRAFFRISFFQFLLYSCYGCALCGFHMPYNNYGAFWGTGSGQIGPEMDRKWTENGPETDQNDW